MPYYKRELEELDVMDDFMFNAITTDEEVREPFCKLMLSVFLQRDIGNIRITAQRVIPGLSPRFRGIRMDVEVDEDSSSENNLPDMNIYDIEPHIHNDIDLFRHNRFYQAKIDSKGLKSGERNFNKLPNLYVITILNEDPFGYDYMMYRVRNRCEEVPEAEYEDGLTYIYFYTGGSKGGSDDIQSMLKYFKHSTEENVTNEITRKLHDYVGRVKIQPEVRDAYMTFEDKIYYERKEEARTTIVECICVILKDKGTLSDSIITRLNNEKNIDVLKAWLKLAAKVDSIDDFIKQM